MADVFEGFRFALGFGAGIIFWAVAIGLWYLYVR